VNPARAAWALLAAGVLSGCASGCGGSGPPAAAPVTSAPAAAQGSFGFLSEVDGRPVTWSRCRPITWELNTGGVEPAVVDLVRDAVDRVATASGFAFDDRGTTDAVEGTSGDLPQALGVDVLVEIVPDTATDLLSGKEWARTDVRPVDGRIGQAVVAVSDTADGQLAVDYSPMSWGALVMHELGHVLGLAESADRDDLMFPTLGQGSGRVSPDDQAGFDALAEAGACRR
jgi:hypothetical protein